MTVYTRPLRENNVTHLRPVSARGAKTCLTTSLFVLVLVLTSSTGQAEPFASENMSNTPNSTHQILLTQSATTIPTFKNDTAGGGTASTAASTHVTLQPTPAQRGAGWALLTLGTLSIGSAGLSYLDHLDAAETARASLPSADALRGDKGRYNRARKESDFFYGASLVQGIAGLTAIGFGTYFLLFSADAPAETRLAVTPNGLQLNGQF